MADPAAPVRPSASEPPVLGVWSSPAIEDVLFPELKDFFKTSITGPAVRRLREAYPICLH